jgi:hypothetical protein
MKSKALDLAYSQGYNDALANKIFHCDCPFPTIGKEHSYEFKSPLREAWMDGYSEGWRVMNKRYDNHKKFVPPDLPPLKGNCSFQEFRDDVMERLSTIEEYLMNHD